MGHFPVRYVRNYQAGYPWVSSVFINVATWFLGDPERGAVLQKWMAYFCGLDPPESDFNRRKNWAIEMWDSPWFTQFHKPTSRHHLIGFFGTFLDYFRGVGWNMLKPPISHSEVFGIPQMAVAHPTSAWFTPMLWADSQPSRMAAPRGIASDRRARWF